MEIDETRGQSVDKSCCSYRNLEVFLAFVLKKVFLIFPHMILFMELHNVMFVFLLFRLLLRLHRCLIAENQSDVYSNNPVDDDKFI